MPEIVPFLANMLSVHIEGEMAGEFPKMPPDAIRRQLFKCMRDLFGAMARQQSLVLVLEDIQWADAIEFSEKN